MNSSKPPAYLYDYVKKNVNLSNFLEVDVACDLQWMKKDSSARCACPMPNHKDTAPSFHVKCLEDTGVWIFHCFGCGSHGTIIDFFEDYYELPSKSHALMEVCKHFGFKDTKDIVINGLRDLKKSVDFQKKIEFVHINTCNLCRMLLRSDYDKNSIWVGKAYARMNKALDKEDVEFIENIGHEASIRMEMK